MHSLGDTVCHATLDADLSSCAEQGALIRHGSRPGAWAGSGTAAEAVGTHPTCLRSRCSFSVSPRIHLSSCNARTPRALKPAAEVRGSVRPRPRRPCRLLQRMCARATPTHRVSKSRELLVHLPQQLEHVEARHGGRPRLSLPGAAAVLPNIQEWTRPQRSSVADAGKALERAKQDDACGQEESEGRVIVQII